MEEMGDQQFKQMVLAYSLLLLHETPMLVGGSGAGWPLVSEGRQNPQPGTGYSTLPRLNCTPCRRHHPSTHLLLQVDAS